MPARLLRPRPLYENPINGLRAALCMNNSLMGPFINLQFKGPGRLVWWNEMLHPLARREMNLLTLRWYERERSRLSFKSKFDSSQ